MSVRNTFAAARMMLAVLLSVLFSAGGMIAAPASVAAEVAARKPPLPVSPKSSRAARALLAEFYARAKRKTDKVAIGQQLITYEYGKKSDPDAWYGDWRQLSRQGLPLPEIMGGELSDLMRYDDFYPNQDALTELIAHGKRGHIVTLVWHAANPVADADFSTPISTAALRDMLDAGTPIGQAWQVQLDRAAAVLQQFEDAGVPVVFRPLHEQNGTFFWWGHDGSTGAALADRQAAWAAVWRGMVADLTEAKGLTNLLFLFGTNQVNYAEVAPPLTYYPGGDAVDLVSIDLYDEQLDMAGAKRGLAYYKDLVGTGKPFGLSEFGQAFGDNGTGRGGAKWDARTLSKRIRDSYPATVFAIAWYSSREGVPPVPYVFALPDVAHAGELLDDPLIDTQ